MRLFLRLNHKKENGERDSERAREEARESVTAATVGRKEKHTIM